MSGRGGARTWRDEAASELAARHAAPLGLAGPALVLDDPVDTLAATLEEQGLEVRRWWRRAAGGRPASAWPTGSPCGTAALRLPRARDELEMMAHAAAARLGPGGRLLVYGARDEGAASAGRSIGDAFGTVRTVASGGHCRLLLAADPLRAPELRSTLDHWALRFDPGVPGLPAGWTSFPGVFAHGRVDGGTALLLGLLPDVARGARILDFGCGHGLLGAAAGSGSGGVAGVAFLDVDAVALEAVRRNVPGARTVLSDGWAAAPTESWDGVVSNPPYHRGKGESMEVVEELVSGARERLTAEGTLSLVVQRRLPVEPLLREAFVEVAILGDDGPWRVWSGRRPLTSAARRP